MQASNKITPKEERMIKFLRLGGQQARVAKQLCVSRQYFNLWLNGKRSSKRLDAAFEELYRNTITTKTRRSS